MWWTAVVLVGVAGGTDLGLMIRPGRRPGRTRGWGFLACLLGVVLLATAAGVYPVG